MRMHSFSDLVKDMTSSSVHTPTAIGNEYGRRKPKAKDFKATIAETKPTEAADLAKCGLPETVYRVDTFSPLAKRDLHTNGNGTAKSPFLYDPNALGSLRPDQVPRFFGALTDSDKLPTKEVKLSGLHAMQDRVDPAKVKAIGDGGGAGKLAVVVRHNDKDYIADGHHRLTAAWLKGDETAQVHYKDLEPVDHALKRRPGPPDHVLTVELNDGDCVEPLARFLARIGEVAGGGHSFSVVADEADGEPFRWDIDGDGADRILSVKLDGKKVKPDMSKAEGPIDFRVAKVDDQLGLVFGFAIVCKVNGEDYYDLNVDHAGPHAGERVPEHVPEGVMTKAAMELSEVGAPGNEMHDGPDKGHYPFLFPLTTDIAKALGIATPTTGLLCGFKPTPDVLAKYKSGEYRGFSIEGRRLSFTEHQA